MILHHVWHHCLFRLPPRLFERLTGRKRDVLFLWVPKCAGMSIYKALVKYGCARDKWLTPTGRFSNRGVVTFGHVNVLQLIERRTVARDYFENAFKFGFVRNPFDRLVSLFHYLRTLGGDGVPEDMSFEEFCGKVDRGEHLPVGLYNHKGLNQCNPMVDWLTDPHGKSIADFVGRFETLHDDFRKVCDVIGIGNDLPHENRTDHRPYRHYYTENSRAIVERVYRQDLDTFGYEF